MQLLIIYGTNRGQTAKVAEHIARSIRALGDDVDVVDGRSIPTDLNLARYDAVLVGASVIAGRFQRYIVDFSQRCRDQLQRMPSAFFSVSLTEAEPEPDKRARAMRTISRFVEETGWRPDKIASFAGSIAYLRYRWIMRVLWRRLPLPEARGGDGTARGSAVFEYTDWDAVTRFATEFAATARTECAVAAPA